MMIKHTVRIGLTWKRQPKGKRGGAGLRALPLKTSVSAKFAASAVLGNLYVRDTDRHIETTYPLIAIGGSSGAGITLYSSTIFRDVKLRLARSDWSGATLSLFTQGGNLIVGSNFSRLCVTLPDRQSCTMQTKAMDHFSIGADISINARSKQFGFLGPRAKQVPY